MKALLVAAAPVAGTIELVSRLAETADLVIAVDGGGAVCVDAGVKPDLIVGDLDSIDPSALEWLRAGGTQVRSFPAEKDQTDLELALDEARRLEAEEVVVTAASSGRLDHTLAAIGAIAVAADLRPVLVEPEVQCWILSAGARSVLTLQGSGATFSVFACGSSASVTVSGAKWPLDRHRLAPWIGLGLGNVVSGLGGARVSVHAGTIAVLCPRMPDAVRAEAR